MSLAVSEGLKPDKVFVQLVQALKILSLMLLSEVVMARIALVTSTERWYTDAENCVEYAI